MPTINMRVFVPFLVFSFCSVTFALIISPVTTRNGKVGRAEEPRKTSSRLNADQMPDLSDLCLGCICEATTNCNLTIGCTRDLCGPFLISRAYWIDAGQPVVANDNPSRQGAYETCTNDPFCAATTVRQYMARFAQDCNGDRVLDCDDYARIHYLGGYQCSLSMKEYMYYHVFQDCRAVALRLSG